MCRNKPGATSTLFNTLTKLIHQFPARRIPVTLQPKIRAELTQLEELEVIEKAEELK